VYVQVSISLLTCYTGKTGTLSECGGDPKANGVCAVTAVSIESSSDIASKG